MRAVSTVAYLEPSELKAFARRSDAIGALWLSGHLALIAALGILVVWAGGWSVLAWPAMAALGVALMALFAPLHETTHRTPFRSLWLNRAAGLAAGLVLMLPPEWFRLFHLTHHRHTQNPRLDPEIAGAPPLTRWRYLWRLTGLPYWTAQIRVVLSTAAGTFRAPWLPPARSAVVAWEGRAFLSIYLIAIAGSLATGNDLLVRLYVIPALLGQPVLRAILMAEHGGVPFVAGSLANTRTTLAGTFIGLLFWNAGYHAEHHFAPGVPFWSLPRLHRRLGPFIEHTATSYIAAHRDIRASFR